ncbi:MAG: HupE/UreJ family protein [Saprospiraceae bacterium]
MQSDFFFYFQMGFRHIVDWAALDHILFLIALCAVYTFSDWKKVLILVTAFTLGHSVTLLIAGMDWFRLPAAWIELVIPITIVLAGLYNIFTAGQTRSRLVYATTLLYGLIHGLGFSNTFRAMLFPGEEMNLIRQLLGFNVGVEAGQLLVVCIILAVATVAIRFVRTPSLYWTYALSAIAVVWALQMVVVRLPEVM